MQLDNCGFGCGRKDLFHLLQPRVHHERMDFLDASRIVRRDDDFVMAFARQPPAVLAQQSDCGHAYAGGRFDRQDDTR